MNYRQKTKRAKRKSILESELGYFASYKEYKDYIRHLKNQVSVPRWHTWCRIALK